MGLLDDIEALWGSFSPDTQREIKRAAGAAPGEPPKKIDLLRGHMRAGDWRRALALAARFPRLGPQKVAIQWAHEAVVRPAFCRALGRDPAALVEAGIAALRECYE